MTKYRRVQVIWRDAETHAGNYELSEVQIDIEGVQTTVGFLVGQSDKTYLLCSSIDGQLSSQNGQTTNFQSSALGISDIMRIPADWVTKIEDI